MPKKIMLGVYATITPSRNACHVAMVASSESEFLMPHNHQRRTNTQSVFSAKQLGPVRSVQCIIHASSKVEVRGYANATGANIGAGDRIAQDQLGEMTRSANRNLNLNVRIARDLPYRPIYGK